MKILTIQISKVKKVEYKGRPVETGFFKEQVKGPLKLLSLKLEGDEQADLKVHGGLDKALYAYPYDSYVEWKKFRPEHTYEPGAFGENLCMETLDEKSIYIGSTYRLGEAEVQVTQPRFPCFKLGIKFNDHSMIKSFMNFGRPGVYFRVLKEGMIKEGDTLELLEQDQIRFSITEFVDLYFSDKKDIERVKEILTIPSLNHEWRAQFERMI
nr:MOSC domain-containing protein [Bacteriovorax sp. HI3]